MRTFPEHLADAQKTTGSSLCVGLDPDPARLPGCLSGLPLGDAVRRFCLDIIEATIPFACAFKANLAFFENLGTSGPAVLKDIVKAVPTNRILVADGKRGDIGNTARIYARAVFGELNCGACTVSPYMGRDAVTPFLEWPGRCAFVLVRTSNTGAGEIQNLMAGDRPLFEHVAGKLPDWAEGKPGTVGAVVGATKPDAIRKTRELLGPLPLLIPGVGAQGGKVDAVLAAAEGGPILVNNSRQILYASSDSDYASAAEAVAAAMASQLRV